MAKKKKADRRLTTPMKGKLILVFGGIIFLFLILVVKLCYVTATKGKEYETAVLSQQKHDSTILPFERGKIMTGMEISWLPMRRFIHSYWNRRIFCFKIKNMKKRPLMRFMSILDLVRVN